MKTLCMVSVLSLMLNGCGTYTPKEVGDPKAISLSDAMSEVAYSLIRTRQITEAHDKFGLIADEVSITFNVSSKANADGKLCLAPAGIPVAGGTVGGSVGGGFANESLRSNQIVVKFKNLATADLSKGNLSEVKRCNQTPRPKDCDHILYQQEFGRLD